MATLKGTPQNDAVSPSYPDSSSAEKQEVYRASISLVSTIVSEGQLGQLALGCASDFICVVASVSKYITAMLLFLLV